ncbi:hypothetical protein IMAU30156_01574 [Lactobacillus helveticus]|nr:hypothetical protein [Lactobacillus helveticus]NRN85861.1 hypothetical protein [Lactobacillus helveticus]NRO00667.1 hypothetical protein [Lactobacillus helveticus]NRO45465.1 hypothetical protein [Lactobacillus helveticus]NRO55109.1 hypothetical protein [Lactobacillus helveticus]
MATYHTIIKSLWYIFLLILGYIIPVFGFIPILYLKYKSKTDTSLQEIRRWIKCGLILQIVYVILLLLSFLLFMPVSSLITHY